MRKRASSPRKRASSPAEPERDLVEQYKAKRHIYEEFCDRLHDLICRLLKTEECHIAITEKRAKEVESLRKKLERIEKDITLSSVDDLVGVRVVTLTRKDVDAVEVILRKEFGATPESAFTVKRHDEISPGEDLFGYRATHVYFRFYCARANLTEWNGFKGLLAEVQIKTLMQHTWAVLRHKLIYKPIEGFGEISEFALRPIYIDFKSLAVHTETADDKLGDIEKRHAEIVKSQRAFTTLVKEGRAETERLTSETLDVFVKNNKALLTTAADVAVQAGFERVDKPGSLEHFVKYAKACGWSKIGDFTEFLGRIKRRRLDLTAICKKAESYRYRRPAALPFDVLIFLLALDHEAAYSIFQSDYTPSIRKVITAVRAAQTRPQKK